MRPCSPHGTQRNAGTAPQPAPPPVAIETYARVFEEEGALDKLEAFASLNGPRHYRLPPNEERT
jgi:dihydroorotase